MDESDIQEYINRLLKITNNDFMAPETKQDLLTTIIKSIKIPVTLG